LSPHVYRQPVPTTRAPPQDPPINSFHSMDGSIPPPTSTSYKPDEPPASLATERYTLLCQLFGGVGFGMVLILYLQTLTYLLTSRGWKQNRLLLLLSSLLFVDAVLYFTADTILVMNMLINDRNFPGGPAAYLVEEFSFPVIMMGNAAFPIQSWLADGFLIYRCFVVYGRQYWVTIIPCLLLLGSFVTGSLVLNNEAAPQSSFWTRTSINFAVPYFSLTIALNTLVTIMIVAKLLVTRQRNKNILGNTITRTYTSISAMLTESAALNCGTSIVFLIPYARSKPVSTVFQNLVCYNSIVATLLIVVRVAQGRAWTPLTSGELTSVKFNHDANVSTLRSTDRSNVTSSYPQTIQTRDIELELVTDREKADTSKTPNSSKVKITV